MSDTNGQKPTSTTDRPGSEAKSPFEVPDGWIKMPGDDVAVSRDGIVQVRLVSEPEKEVRLTVDGGTFNRRQDAKVIGDFLMSLLTGPDRNARSFKGFDTDLLIYLMDNWHLLDKKALRAFIRESIGPIVSMEAIDVSDELEESDE